MNWDATIVTFGILINLILLALLFFAAALYLTQPDYMNEPWQVRLIFGLAVFLLIEIPLFIGVVI